MIRTDLPRLRPPDVSDLRREPQIALLVALDATLHATVAALHARHARSYVACWAPDAPEDIRLSAAIVECARSLRQLIDDYDAVVVGRKDDFGEIPF
ncbi:MAG TPA: hypothetical protein VGA65_04755 [Hyphomicrobium sp.]